MYDALRRQSRLGGHKCRWLMGDVLALTPVGRAIVDGWLDEMDDVTQRELDKMKSRR